MIHRADSFRSRRVFSTFRIASSSSALYISENVRVLYDVGSSRSKISGLSATAIASMARCDSPPLASDHSSCHTRGGSPQVSPRLTGSSGCIREARAENERHCLKKSIGVPNVTAKISAGSCKLRVYVAVGERIELLIAKMEIPSFQGSCATGTVSLHPEE